MFHVLRLFGTVLLPYLRVKLPNFTICGGGKGTL